MSRTAEVLRFVRRWRDPAYPPRRAAEEGLRRQAGFPPAMTTEILDALFSKFTRASLERIRRRPPAYLAGPPRRIAYIFPSNVPDPLVVHVLLAALVKKAVWIKLSRRLSLFGSAFLKSLSEELPHVAADFTLSEDAFYRKLIPGEPVVAFGSDATLDQVSRRAAGRSLFGFGHRISAGIVFRPVDGTAAACARDVWLYDQRGCLSPRLYFVQGDPGRFAARLGSELDRLQKRHGPVKRPRRLATERKIFIDRFKAQAAAGKGVALRSSSGQAVGIRRFASLAEVERALSPMRGSLACLAVAGTGRQRRQVQKTFKGIRVCRHGRAQRPKLEWNLKGEPRGV